MVGGLGCVGDTPFAALAAAEPGQRSSWTVQQQQDDQRLAACRGSCSLVHVGHAPGPLQQPALAACTILIIGLLGFLCMHGCSIVCSLGAGLHVRLSAGLHVLMRGGL